MHSRQAGELPPAGKPSCWLTSLGGTVADLRRRGVHGTRLLRLLRLGARRCQLQSQRLGLRLVAPHLPLMRHLGHHASGRDACTRARPGSIAGPALGWNTESAAVAC